MKPVLSFAPHTAFALTATLAASTLAACSLDRPVEPTPDQNREYVLTPEELQMDLSSVASASLDIGQLLGLVRRGAVQQAAAGAETETSVWVEYTAEEITVILYYSVKWLYEHEYLNRNQAISLLVPVADANHWLQVSDDTRAVENLLYFIEETQGLVDTAVLPAQTGQYLIDLAREAVGELQCSAETEISHAECEALIAIYASTDGSGWHNAAGWLETSEPCTWHGVTCAGGSVVQLHLEANQLSGSIPTEMGNLSGLTVLDLGANQLTGAIPPELGNLPNLEQLGLYENQLSGPIPAELGNLANLKWLYLRTNQLTGPIPAELGNLANLLRLTLYANQLSGSIPPELANLSRLEGLSLGGNQLTGPIPPELANLSSLWLVRLDDNRLTGTIPSQLADLSNLRYLTLNTNQLQGAIPPELGNLSNLEVLWLHENELTGLVPLQVAQRGGLIQASHEPLSCVFRPPGNESLQMPDTQQYRDADLDGDGSICGVEFSVQE